MTFNAIESSNDLGRPIYLYAFNLGAATWRYTSSDEDTIINGYQWTATAISDDGVKITGEASTDGLNITCPSSLAPVQMFYGTPPSQPIVVSIFHYHEGDTEAVLGYTGEMLQVSLPTPGQALIACDTISASMQRDGLRLAWQRTCGHALYGLGCNLDKATHAINVRVFDVVNNTVYFQGMDSVPDGALSGGFVEWTHPTRGTEFRAIESQTGNACLMFGLADGLYYGLEAKVYPGCNRTAARCTELGNYPNYGGVPDMPGKSPFDGDPVF
jgi:uncharacterized phage protein (TIGR02218 family)